MLLTLKGLPGIDEENIKNDFKILFIENYTKLNKDQKSSDLIVSDLVKSSFRKIIKNSIQKNQKLKFI